MHGAPVPSADMSAALARHEVAWRSVLPGGTFITSFRQVSTELAHALPLLAPFPEMQCWLQLRLVDAWPCSACCSGTPVFRAQ